MGTVNTKYLAVPEKTLVVMNTKISFGENSTLKKECSIYGCPKTSSCDKMVRLQGKKSKTYIISICETHSEVKNNNKVLPTKSIRLIEAGSK